MNRRQFLRLAAGAGSLALTGCGPGGGRTGLVSPSGPEVATAAARRGPNGHVRTFALRAQPATIDLGGPVVSTWAYGDALPGPEIRVRRGEIIEASVTNALPAETSVHWHGLALRNDMDGMPGVTQQPIAAGAQFTYRFAANTPGTYWFHPHTGLQLDRGLYAPLIVEDPEDPGLDADWVVVLDDWLDGVAGATPEAMFAQLRSSTMTHGGPGQAGMLMGARSELLGGDAGDVSYPYFLLNGRTTADPVVFRAKPRARVRIRFINAGADTAFRVALGGHRMTVTHTDGYPVMPVRIDALLIGMGERYDVTVDLGDGVFPLVALAEGKGATARGLIRTGTGAAPPPDRRPAELDGVILRYAELRAAAGVNLPNRPPDREHEVRLSGSMGGYDWAINGKPFADADALVVAAGERVRLRFVNTSMMWHPMHLHGHTFALGPDGPRKDTVAVLPNRTVTVDFDTDNPGQWMVHCHNAYHQEAGMMRMLGYRA